MTDRSPPVIWFDDVGRSDVARVRGKNASLGEMVQHLGKQGVAVPPEFATTAQAYQEFVEANRLTHTISTNLQDLRDCKISLSEVGQAR